MLDRFGRLIDTLRISVTDRCNFRCAYCMPPGVRWLPRESVLRFEEIMAVAEAAIAFGITRFRLTGGEPLLRRDLPSLVRLLAGLPGIEDLAMTTNGALLAEQAEALAQAGLRRVNVSLDTIDPVRFAEITQGGDVRRVLEGIRAARQAGLEPVKLNCVVGPEHDPRDAEQVAAFAQREGLILRRIGQMNLAQGQFSVVEGGRGGDCPRCNRLRLSPDGQIRPCLFSDLAFSARGLGPVEALRQAITLKPRAGACCHTRAMNAIGG